MAVFSVFLLSVKILPAVADLRRPVQQKGAGGRVKQAMYFVYFWVGVGRQVVIAHNVLGSTAGCGL